MIGRYFLIFINEERKKGKKEDEEVSWKVKTEVIPVVRAEDSSKKIRNTLRVRQNWSETLLELFQKTAIFGTAKLKVLGKVLDL